MDFLREKGLATAQKKASRIAAEGIVATALSEDGKKAVAVEVNAETDFVAKNEKFQQLRCRGCCTGTEHYCSRYRRIPGRAVGSRIPPRL